MLCTHWKIAQSLISYWPTHSVWNLSKLVSFYFSERSEPWLFCVHFFVKWDFSKNLQTLCPLRKITISTFKFSVVMGRSCQSKGYPNLISVSFWIWESNRGIADRGRTAENCLMCVKLCPDFHAPFGENGFVPFVYYNVTIVSHFVMLSSKPFFSFIIIIKNGGMEERKIQPN